VKSVTEALYAYQANDPPVEVDQRWEAFTADGEVTRRLRILALHPDPDNDGRRRWIYAEEPARMKVEVGRLGICPEINLRIVFSPATEGATT
jgi:hypothetical protein